jgi:Polyketide cyclase / dehydrase and lipid transport
MGEWSFEHAVTTRAPRAAMWAFWSDLRNLMRLEPVVERIELDGPFATGTTGRTVVPSFTQEWRLSDVVPELRFAIIGLTPDGGGALSFAWEFEDDGSGGTRMMQRIRATGPEVEHYITVFREMELGAQEAWHGSPRSSIGSQATEALVCPAARKRQPPTRTERLRANADGGRLVHPASKRRYD